MGLFDGMEALGFNEIEETDIFKPTPKPGEKAKTEVSMNDPMSYLYAKDFTCPVCDKSFVNHIIRKSKLRLISIDTDLKAAYETVDPTLYDVLLCNHCGYAALLSYFNQVSDRQSDILMQKIKPRFIAKEYPVPLSMEHAIERYKLALLCAVTKGVKSGEKAILCLKMAWLYRDMNDKDNEMLFLRNALTGFKEAFSNDSFPIGSMDENTTHLLIGELARRTGENAEAMRWLSALVVKRGVPKKIKERATDIRDLIRVGNKA